MLFPPVPLAGARSIGGNAQQGKKPHVGQLDMHTEVTHFQSMATWQGAMGKNHNRGSSIKTEGGTLI